MRKKLAFSFQLTRKASEEKSTDTKEAGFHSIATGDYPK
jgi:hypothetical protein